MSDLDFLETRPLKRTRLSAGGPANSQSPPSSSSSTFSSPCSESTTEYASPFPAWSGPSDKLKVDMRPEDAISVVNLAHLTETRSLLPLALYACAYVDNALLFDGWTREDGTVERLADADLRRCLDAHLFGVAAHERCRSPGLCEAAMRELHHRGTHAERRVRYTIADWRDAIRKLEMGESLC
ncbi:hypothetical protein V8D89_006726 [Ganoderma adspersum]